MKKKRNLWLAGPAAVLALGLWHLLDVKLGVSANGDGWLIGCYAALGIAALLALALLGWLLFDSGRRGREKAALEKIYPVAGLLLGLMYLFVLPPLSAPDEISHYVSAYRLSGVMLGEPAVSRDGRVLLRAEDAWVEDLGGVFEYEADEDGNLQVTGESRSGALKLGETLDESVYKTLWELGVTGQYMPERLERLNGARVASTYPPVTTTPLAYVPQAAGIALARFLGLKTAPLLYLGRLMNLLFFVGLTWLAMRRLPFGREVLFGVAMLPMTLHLSASFSYDVMILGCMFLFTAVCLDLAYGKERVEIKDIVLLMALIAAAGPCKMVYAPMLGLCLLIPVRKFGGRGRWALAAAAVLTAFASAMLLVNSRVIASYATETESYVQWAGEPGYSLTLLIHQPMRLIRMFYQTLLWQAKEWHLTMIGASLGNLDEVLDVPYIAVALFTLGLLGLAFKKPGESARISGGCRVWVFTVCAGCMAAAMLSMLIAWTPLSSRVISGVQGRYFLPFLPVLLMALKNDIVILTKDKNRSILYLMCCLNGYVLLRLFSVVSMRI